MGAKKAGLPGTLLAPCLHRSSWAMAPTLPRLPCGGEVYDGERRARGSKGRGSRYNGLDSKD
jgi:hypothetical protein